MEERQQHNVSLKKISKNVDFAKYVEETQKFQENIKQQLGGMIINAND